MENVEFVSYWITADRDGQTYGVCIRHYRGTEPAFLACVQAGPKVASPSQSVWMVPQGGASPVYAL